jgi:hypothetical protein
MHGSGYPVSVSSSTGHRSPDTVADTVESVPSTFRPMSSDQRRLINGPCALAPVYGGCMHVSIQPYATMRTVSTAASSAATRCTRAARMLRQIHVVPPHHPADSEPSLRDVLHAGINCRIPRKFTVVYCQVSIFDSKAAHIHVHDSTYRC